MPIDRPEELPPEYELTCRVVAMPADTNYIGDIFGGWIMSQVDIAGSILAVRETSGRVATVAVKEFRFLAPILVGHVVSCYARVEAVGNTSITIHLEVYAASQFEKPGARRVAEATLVYATLTAQGKPRSAKARRDG